MADQKSGRWMWGAALAVGWAWRRRRRSAAAVRREAASQNALMCWFPQAAPRREDV